MSATNLIFFVVEILVVFACIAWTTLARPARGLSLCLALLPLFSLSRRFFAFGQFMIYPTIESLSFLFLWVCTLLYESRHPKDQGLLGASAFEQLAILLFLGFALISCLASPDIVFSLKLFFTGAVIPILVYLMARRWIVDRRDLRLFVAAVLAMGVQVIVYSAYQLRLYPDLLSANSEALSTVYAQSPVTSLFYVPFETASVLLAVVPLSAWYRGFGTFRNNLIWVGLTASAVVIGILTFSRGVWLAYAAAILAMLPLVISRIRLRDIGFLLVLFWALYLVLSSLWARNIFDFRLNSVYSDSDQSASLRLLNYALVIRSIPRYLFVGVGLGEYPVIYHDFPLDPASSGHHLWFAHNLVLTLIPEIGFLGALGFIVLFLKGLIGGIRCAMRDWGDPWRKLLYALVISISFSLGIDIFSGNHLVAYLYFLNLDRTYFMAPEMIMLFAELGLVVALARRMTSAHRARSSGRISHSPSRTKQRDEVQYGTN